MSAEQSGTCTRPFLTEVQLHLTLIFLEQLVLPAEAANDFAYWFVELLCISTPLTSHARLQFEKGLVPVSVEEQWGGGGRKLVLQEKISTCFWREAVIVSSLHLGMGTFSLAGMNTRSILSSAYAGTAALTSQS